MGSWIQTRVWMPKTWEVCQEDGGEWYVTSSSGFSRLGPPELTWEQAVDKALRVFAHWRRQDLENR